ncbi:nitronate monooxygenase [Longimicrobium sp.]|uniref:NAD(P)H-dependent flavin oxidoreductase n=1 Tax=Longimicrobium sp. TaxID=2029185 RepID=UPI002E32E0D1|nr:nitronate monooxygenase [Longimicrobium sp.]HEX6041362.1 nitronate monooxygenase [Longimicrobium sp.]
MAVETAFTRAAGVEVPLICGAMYPCSNPELVAAVSEAGGMGIIQPISLTYVHGHEFREGLRYIRRLTAKPVGMNVILESSSKVYLGRMRRYVDTSLEEGVRFFVSSLGNPRWLADTVHAAGGQVYHDVVSRKWAMKALEGGVDGIIAVNDRAGGHAGSLSAQRLLDDLRDLGVPLLLAGGVGDEQGFVDALRMGYAGVQLGTRFIATDECSASGAYKQALIDAGEDDVVLTERITGVPVAVLNTPHVRRMGTRAGPLARWMLRGRRTKHWMRSIYAIRSLVQLKRSLKKESAGATSADYWQAGKSVAGIRATEPAGDIVRRYARAAEQALSGSPPAADAR